MGEENPANVSCLIVLATVVLFDCLALSSLVIVIFIPSKWSCRVMLSWIVCVRKLFS